MAERRYPLNFIAFLGTAGARFVMIRQLRSSGGIWLRYQGHQISLDPGPGALVRALSARPPFDPRQLDTVILTHRHLDHSGDLNVMIEAMTSGGRIKKGTVFLPEDAQGPEGIFLPYLRSYAAGVRTLRPGVFRSGKVRFRVPLRNAHPVQTYGLIFEFGRQRVGYMSDTACLPRLCDAYRGVDTLIMNTVFPRARAGAAHLSLDEAVELLACIRPRRAVLTHFGTPMLRADPVRIERALRKKFPFPVYCAHDGMVLPMSPKKAKKDGKKGI
ncbi:MAG: MBL fold metallo-hydrolase [Candidatus Omnitrophica bacterium]|nr:MBL fold metallo-hydrolase [Candidatus Omnitrophota bacterium]